MDYRVQTGEKDIGWFIDTVLIHDIEQVIACGSGYLAFGLIAGGIEVLGALTDEKEFGEKDLSEARFKDGIREFFPAKYAKYNNPDKDYFLFRDLRCGMAHILRPQGKLAFVGLADARTLRLTHLEERNVEGNYLLVLVIEEFFEDFKDACRKAKNAAKKKSHAKLQRGYVTLYSHVATESTASPTLSAGAPILKVANYTGIAPAAAQPRP